MVSEIEIILVIIVLIYSGIWAFIKAVDDETDNKWVFLVPAGVLGLGIISESSDSCGFIIPVSYTHLTLPTKRISISLTIVITR